MPHHICFVTDEIYPGTRGGIGRLLHTTIGELLQADSQVSVLLSMADEAVAQFREHALEHFPALHVYSVNELLSDSTADENIPLWGFHFYDYHESYRIALALRRLCARHHVDGVEFNDYRGLGYVALKWRRLWGDEFANLAMWVRLHGSAELCYEADGVITGALEQQHLFAMERYCLQHADGWISPSNSTAQWYQQVYQIVEKPIVNGPPRFETIGAGNTHPRAGHGKVLTVLYYGKLQQLKGVDTLIRAGIQLCEMLNGQVRFEIVGPEAPPPFGESYLIRYQRLIPPKWRDRFSFRGSIATKQLEEIALACDIAVVPSLIETFCLAAHELNWIGIPLVVNNIAGFRDYFLDSINCRKFDGTAEHLAQILLELHNEPATLQHFEWNADKILALHRGTPLYQEALETFKPASQLTQSIPLVSIIMPYYNMQVYVDEAINSILLSTYTNWEVILVDDGSPDADAIQKFAQLQHQYRADRRFRFVQKSNGGLGSARNYGFTFAQGAYILPLDSDDVIHSHYLERAVRALNAQPNLSAVSCFVTFFADGQSAEQTIDYVIPYDLHAVLITFENRAGVACSVFRRNVFERLSYSEELTSYEDWDLWWQLAENNMHAEVMPLILYRYRRRHNSMFNTTAVSRHAHLIGQIAKRHESYIQQHGEQIFRTYAYAVRELHSENIQLRSNASNRMYTALRRIYHEARDIRGSTTYRVARALRIAASPFRRLVGRPSTTEDSAFVHAITIEVLGTHNKASKGQEVWFGGLRPSGSNIYLLNQYRSSGEWSHRELSHPMLDQAIVGVEPGASLRLRAARGAFGLVFNHFAWAGKVRIRIDRHVQEIDLYAPEDQAGFHEYRWNGSKLERVEVPC